MSPVQTRLTAVRGDITVQDTEVIVNAANTTLLGGGGVDGAIHRAAGPALLEECRAIASERGGCPTGGAVRTGGGRLRARSVVHAVGPVWSGGGRGEGELLAYAYRQSLRLAAEVAAASISFPSISTGAYRFPVDLAAPIAVETVAEFLIREPHRFEEIRFVLFSERDLAVYEAALDGARTQRTSRAGAA